MKVCANGHHEIVYNLSDCPLCRLITHNSIVHDFIESDEINLVDKLVEYQEMRRQEKTK